MADMIARFALTVDLVGSLGQHTPFAQTIETAVVTGFANEIELTDPSNNIQLALPGTISVKSFLAYTQVTGWQVRFGPSGQLYHAITAGGWWGFANAALSAASEGIFFNFIPGGAVKGKLLVILGAS